MESHQVAGKYKDELIATARKMCQKPKGLLASDEATNIMALRFKAIDVENTEDNRRTYRELLYSTPGLEEYISGVIMYEEAFYQKSSSGKSFVDLLREKDIIVGIKADKGPITLPGSTETTISGLDDLAKRAAEYYEHGARFAKWRGFIKISSNTPSDLAIQDNAWVLGRYASICQEAGLVPIIEPDVVVDGSSHTIERCVEVSEKYFAAVVKACHDNHVMWEGAILKPSMVTPGLLCESKVTAEEIAIKTVRTVSRMIPVALPGIMFLSGGQSEEEATMNLNEMNKLDCMKPWNLSFCFARALQYSCLRTWKGKAENVEEAQKVFLGMAKNNSLATEGKYVPKENKH
jgi:fructose-bisphosphate aldolase class I